MSSARNINLKGFSELVEELAQRPGLQDTGLRQMLNLFREMLPLMRQLEESGSEKSEKLEEVAEKLRNYRGDLSRIFAEFCQARGSNQEEMEQYLENPRNFPLKEWEEIQAVKRHVEEKAINASCS